ncbi:hypothetical protein Asi03nite_44370 [Actinoplanes siamensis]|uniref:Diguanylate cyclase (GGDEF)-like protein n=1 Tax=Actinoplanes siamensis TaxID=1223317 RepID=A0A919N9W3_9ACTN|nr:hypothetical protein Asi03nite_44370 [Actinoplanes siamensis]
MLAAGVAVIGGYYLLPSGSLVQSLVYNTVALSSGALVLAGVRLHRPRRRALWYCFAAGEFTAGVAEVVYSVYLYGFHQSPFPSAADVFYVARYPLLIAGFVLLVGQRRDRDVRGFLDAAVVATGFGLVFWVFVLRPTVFVAGNSVLAQLLNTAYPAADTLLLAILTSLLTGSGVRNTSTRLLAGAAMALLLADIGFSVLISYFSFNNGTPFDALWLLSYVLWGVAALHPSMAADHTAVPRTPRTGLTHWRQLLLTASSMLAPGILFVPGIAEHRADWMVVAGGAMVLFLLVSLRMSGFVNQVHKQAAQLERLAQHDELTGLANRRQFQAALHHGLDGSRSYVALLDLTGFKKVNDQFGHHVGDLLLSEVATRLTAAAGGAASVVRMGGDEFALLMPGATREDAVGVAENVGGLLSQPIRADGRDLLIGANIGLTDTTGLTEPHEALRRADVAMYAAKEAGEPYRWYHPDLDRRAGDEARLGADLRIALNEGQFRLVYQPIVDLPDGRIRYVESLVRWEHPVRGLVSPVDFIPAAEQNGLIVELGEWILRTTCDQFMRWQQEHGAAAPERISVNVSARQLAEPGFAQVVADVLAATGMRPDHLIVEVTETAVFGGGVALQTVNDIHARGVRIALDDFGTGHSSLGLLQTVPVDVLKVDKSFVDNVTMAGRHAVIPTVLIQASDGLGLSAVAEGVETAEQAAELYRLGYRLAQGYHFGKPVAAPDFAARRTGLNPVSRRRTRVPERSIVP